MSGAYPKGDRSRTSFLDYHNQRHRFSAIEMTAAAPPPPPRGSIFLGVDVGTGSARAGRFLPFYRLLNIALIIICLVDSDYQ